MTDLASMHADGPHEGPFTPNEARYLAERHIARLATIGADGTPHVVPVEYRFDAVLGAIEIGGFDITTTKKFRDVQRDGRVAIVIDDEVVEGAPQGVEIRGTAVVVPTGGRSLHDDFEEPLIRVTPGRILAWGIDTHPHVVNARSVG